MVVIELRSSALVYVLPDVKGSVPFLFVVFVSYNDAAIYTALASELIALACALPI